VARKSVDANGVKNLRNLWSIVFLVLLRAFTKKKFDVPNDPEEIIIGFFREKAG